MNGITYLGDVELLKREQAADEFTAIIISTLKENKQFSRQLERWHKFMIINGVLCHQSRKSSTKPKTQILVPKCFIFDQLHVKSGHLVFTRPLRISGSDCFGLDMSRIFIVQLKNVSDVKD